MDSESTEKPKASFVHLHVHSHYSLLNAIPKPKELVAAAKADGQTALALTDLGALYGAVDFYKATMGSGVKPIIGLEAFVAPRTMEDREGSLDKPRNRVIFLAKNNEGYVHLIKMVTESFMRGFYYKPRIDHALIEKYKENLVCILPSFSSEPVSALKDHLDERAHASLDWYKGVFGDDLYMEITHHPEITGHMETQARIKELAKEHGVQIMAAHDVYYLKKEDHRAREAMIKIQSGGILDMMDDGEGEHEDFSFISQTQACEYFADEPEALANTLKIADMCGYTMTPGEVWHFPNFIIESGKEPDDELRDAAYEGYKWRGYLPDNADALKRLDYELDVIKKKGYAKYFLAVGDLLREARERGILTTIRGSVAGSFATYVLGITNVDPLEYNLPFERFLNPERPSAPDIDMDYADNRRDEIISYARDKYGRDHVAQICTFGTMMAKAAVRDIARVLGHPYSLGDQISKIIPVGSQGSKMTIDKALDIEPDFAKMYKEDAAVREIVDLAKKIEGRARQLGVHAAGVVISPLPLTEFTPVQPDTKTGKLITQYESNSVGEDGVGLLKFDFLGIRNLAILADATKLVRETRGIDIDIENIRVDDEKTFAILAKGETMGLFQLNGSGMTAFLKQLKPSTIHDINAMVALYRPGPMECIPQYIERKHNPMLVTYLDPRLKEILERSFGVITYQDDVMMIAIKLAGYSWLDADKLRKAMGKKVPEVMAAEKEKLFKGFLEYGKLSEANAEALWLLIEPFAAYGFNKAHAASYGRVAYQTAYMKANYPVEYMTAVLTAESGNMETITDVIHECERMGVHVLPPDVNESRPGFAIVKDEAENPAHIRFGLSAIKGFGEGIAQTLLAEREHGGTFTSMSDFLRRVVDRGINKKSMEALTMAGAFDSLEERGTLLHNMEKMLEFNKAEMQKKESAQDDLFALMGGFASDLVLERVPDVPKSQKLAWEKELIGIYINGHPVDDYAAQLRTYPSIGRVLREWKEDQEVKTAGMIEMVRPLLTKKGDKMAFIKLVNRKDSIELVMFPKLYETQGTLLVPGSVIAVKGKVSVRNDEKSIILDALKSFTAPVV